MPLNMRLVDFWLPVKCACIHTHSRTHILSKCVSLILFHLLFAHLSSLPGISARPSRPESAVVIETLVA